MFAVKALLTATAVCLTALWITSASATTSANGSANRVLEYLLRTERGDGGFPLTPGQSSSTMASGWTALAIGAAHKAGLISGNSDAGSAVITYLERVASHQSDPGSVQRTVLALRALGQPVSAVDGVPLLRRLEHLVGSNGSVHNQTNLTSWEILALRAAGAPVPADTVRWLQRQQDGDGGFNFQTGGRSTPSDPDDTGAALEALVAAGAAHAASGANTASVNRAIRYLRRDQNRDGGFGSPRGANSNAQSTAWAEQGLIAVGVSPAGFHRNGGRTPIHYLQAMVNSSGLVDYAKGTVQTPIWTGAEVLPALLQQSFPVYVSASTRRSGASGHGSQTGGPQVGTPLAGSGGGTSQAQPNVARSVGRLIVALHLQL